MNINKMIFRIIRNCREIQLKLVVTAIVIQELFIYIKTYTFKQLNEEDVARNKMILEIKESRKLDIVSTVPRTWKEYLEKKKELVRIDCRIIFISNLEEMYYKKVNKNIKNRA